ncbi:MAG: hypothetical protein GY696_40750 [Gammaproteobacteria bacterium]|nr:hypothetical protein [Gammaproteobacteria bacterium]
MMALFCILIFFRTTAGNLTTIIVAAVKAGPGAAADEGWRLYAYPHQLLNITLQNHKKNDVEETDKKVNQETGL